MTTVTITEARWRSRIQKPFTALCATASGPSFRRAVKDPTGVTAHRASHNNNPLCTHNGSAHLAQIGPLTQRQAERHPPRDPGARECRLLWLQRVGCRAAVVRFLGAVTGL